jgi:two-component system sensor histidine kinase DesK
MGNPTWAPGARTDRQKPAEQRRAQPRTAWPWWTGLPGRPQNAGAGFAFHALACVAIAVLTALGPLLEAASWAAGAAGLAYATALAGGHLLAFDGEKRRRRGAIAVQGLLGLAAVVHLGGHWSVLAGFFGGSLALAVKRAPVVSCTVAVALVAGVSAGFRIDGWSFSDSVRAGGGAAVLTLVLIGLGRLARLAAEREETHRLLTEQAVTEERLRFSRDVHDLLGLSLSAITLKGELIGRMVADQPQRARDELEDLLSMSRRALADVRAVAAGYRELRIEDECRVAAAVLRAAGVEAEVDHRPAELSAEIATMLAAALREAVTNVLRHSQAAWCHCSIQTSGGVARLVVINDGVTAGEPDDDPEHGAGLGNLAYRVGRLGGEFVAGPQPDGTHRLSVSVPSVPCDQRRHAS